MSVDITELVDNLKAEVNSPGTDSFPNANDADWEIRLVNAFWDTVLDGIISGYTSDEDGNISPMSGTTELGRELQQLIVFYAGISIVRNTLRTLNASFRAKAGPVEYETTQAATVMREILEELVRRRNIILQRLSDVGTVETAYVDMVVWRDESMRFGDSYWIR